jgi:RNA polymerase sigma-70 factor, ECF subfamily
MMAVNRSRFHLGARIKKGGTCMDPTSSGSTDLLERLRAGDKRALAELFEGYRDRLRRMVELRMDPRLRARLDASDVLQEAYLELAGDLDAYLRDPKLGPLLWMRLHVGRRLTTLHRKHLGTRMRDAGLEISLYREALPEASSAALASMLLGRHTSPTQAAQRAERLLRVQEGLNSLDPIDREILALRHFEQLNRAETAQVLGISQEAGAKRYFRALKRLKDVLASSPGGGEEL